MRRFLLLLFAGICATASHAQLNGSGYYRFQNIDTKRYLTITDHYSKLDYTSHSAETGAMVTIMDFDQVAVDPSSVIYISQAVAENSEGISQNDIISQGYNTHSFYDVHLTLMDVNLNKEKYRAYASKSGLTVYLVDAYNIWGNQKPTGTVTTGENASNTKGVNWSVLPMSAANYLGIKPDVTTGDGYWKSYCVCFPIQLSSGMKAYTISAVDETKGYAVVKEVSGTIAGGTPIIVKCNSANTQDNKLTIGNAFPALGEKPIKSSGNSLEGVYFCNSKEFDNQGAKNPHYDAIPYNASTMRVLGKTSKGELAFIKATNLTHIPANSCYITVSASAPDELLVVDKIPEDPVVRGDLNGDGKVNITDIISILNLIKNGEYRQEADLNNDGKVNITDIIAILNIIKG
jgi:hypothetical protein